MQVMGKGNLKLYMNGVTQLITYVYYFPSLKNNLLSDGQLMQKELTIMFKDRGCKVLHTDRGLILSKKISSNRIFVVSAPVVFPMCVKISLDNVTHLWNSIYGNLSFKGLDTLIKKEMVNGMPSLKNLEETCSDCLWRLRKTRKGGFVLFSLEIKTFCDATHTKVKTKNT